MAPDKFHNAFAVAALFGVLTLASGCGRGPTGAPTAKSDRARFDWYLKNSAGDYMTGGQHDPKWDSYALRAFTNICVLRVWGARTNAGLFAYCGDIDRAIDAGCKDPLVLYFQLRCEEGTGNSANEKAMARWTNIAQALDGSSYSPIRKFYGNLRGAIALKAASGTNFPPQIHEFRNRAWRYASGILRDRETPVEEALEVATDMHEAVSKNPVQKWDFIAEAESAMKENWPRAWQTHYLLGDFATERAWKERGGGYSDSVSKESWSGFAKYLGEAEKHLGRAWRIHPDERIATQMITVELGQGRGLDRMELWFNRAMSLNPNSYDAAHAKYNYLRPKWYGNPEMEHAFAVECVQSKKWGGHVPLIMIDFHDDYSREARDRIRYYRDPRVWEDIHAALDKFFALNPDDEGWHHNYFWYAAVAQQWDIAARELALMGPIVNYDYFGGKDEFNALAAETRAKAGGAATAPVQSDKSAPNRL